MYGITLPVCIDHTNSLTSAAASLLTDILGYLYAHRQSIYLPYPHSPKTASLTSAAASLLIDILDYLVCTQAEHLPRSHTAPNRPP